MAKVYVHSRRVMLDDELAEFIDNDAKQQGVSASTRLRQAVLRDRRNAQRRDEIEAEIERNGGVS